MGLSNWIGAFGPGKGDSTTNANSGTIRINHDLERGYEAALMVQSIELEHYNDRPVRPELELRRSPIRDFAHFQPILGMRYPKAQLGFVKMVKRFVQLRHRQAFTVSRVKPDFFDRYRRSIQKTQAPDAVARGR